MIEFIVKCGASFVGMTVLDFVWAKYTLSVAKRRPAIGGGYAVAIMVFNGLVTLAYVGDPRLLIPAALGAFVGTYVGVRRGVKHE